MRCAGSSRWPTRGHGDRVSELEMVTQSGVSRALARLEAQLGTPLLRRHGRTLRG